MANFFLQEDAEAVRLISDSIGRRCGFIEPIEHYGVAFLLGRSVPEK